MTAAAAAAAIVSATHAVSGRLSSSLSLGADPQTVSNSAANGHLVEGQQCLTWVDSEVRTAWHASVQVCCALTYTFTHIMQSLT